MARYTGPVIRLCRREGMCLDIGGKCPRKWDQRPYPPGQHGWRRGKVSEYHKQLREKQILKRTFGVLERQFQRYFAMAKKARGNTGSNLLQIFERRLDAIVYRMGFAVSRPQARQMINHGHFLVNGKKVDIPSYMLSVDDVVTPAKKERSTQLVKGFTKECTTLGVTPPSWMEVDAEGLTGKMIQLPSREEFPFYLQEQLIIEVCSK